ncbi:MAG: TetR/AcrR family transcriptional regulator [Acidobacteriota bacterium]
MAIYLADIEPRDPEQSADDASERRRRDPEATRLAILDAAEDLFVSHGPAATSLSQIAKKAEVTKSLIHHHFGSKEELWRAVQERHFADYFDMQMRLLEEADDPDTNLLEQSMVAYYRFLQEHPDKVRFMTWTFATKDDTCPTAHEKELFELGIQRIREAQERGRIRADLEPFFVIKILIGMPFAWHQTREETLGLIDSDIDSDTLDDMFLVDMMKVFFEGVRPRSTDAPTDSTD